LGQYLWPSKNSNQEGILALAKCSKVIGNVLIAEKKLPSFPLNPRLTGRFIAKTAGRKREPKDSKDREF